MNNLEKSRSQEIIHGLPYKPRNKQPSMFQILTWNQTKQQNNLQRNRNYHEGQCQKEMKRSHQNCYYQVQEKENYKTNLKNTIPRINFATSPHKIKHQLYMYNDQQTKAKKIIQDATKKILQQNQSPNKQNVKISQRSKSKSLNPNNEEDLLEIKNRKNKIKNFKMLSRQLPDSAFTTYFGKPAFSNYGSGSTSAQKKSFNVMPHAGKNHPQYQQSYEGALKKGKQINVNYVPKKPIEIYNPSNDNLENSDYYQIPIKRPNLINSNRFTEDKSYLQRKAHTPKHNQLNSLSARQSFHKDYRLKTSHDSLNKRLNKAKSMKAFEQQKNQHPLVQSRDHLKQILDEKKRQQNKIAYKVTECYPLASQNCDRQCETRCSRWNQMRPAGIKSPRSDHADDVFYPNKIWT